MHETVEFDHHPELVENGQGLYRLERLGISETLRDPHDRREFFANLSDEDFKHMFGYVNSITRGEQINYDYEDGEIAPFATPPLEDKEPLMNLTFQTIRDILGSAELDDRAALRRAGLTAAGASGFIHPKANGNGRVARVMHYLMEFGTERGEQAFEEELYAIIGNIRHYNTDRLLPLYNTPAQALRLAIDKVAAHRLQAEGQPTSDVRKLATARVETFLGMMRGTTHVAIEEDIVRSDGLNADRTSKRVFISAGTYDGVGLYEAEYLRLSTIPNRSPDEVPEGAERVKARKFGHATDMIEMGSANDLVE